MSSIAAQPAFHPTISDWLSGDHLLARYHWPAPEQAVRGRVLLVHGLGEHMGRYNQVAFALTHAGFAVQGFDHVGHGLSSGVRGDVASPHQLVDDLAAVVADVQHHQPSSQPLILLGHSMGGLVVARALAEKACVADGAVLSSPAFGAFTNPVQKLLLATMPRLLPHLRVSNGLQLAWLARDAQAIRAYREDRLVHDRISAQLAAWIIDEGDKAVQQAPLWDTPALLIYAGQDHLVNPQGSVDFAKAAPAHLLQAQCFNVMYHEIFNDPEKHLVFIRMNAWLDSQCPAAGA
jgi:alpha-beta hydrolase superfamily lysophospholipase